MQIFYGDKDINYNNPSGFAFLNWHFDDSMGANIENNPSQKIIDNFEMGKAYMANAILTLYSIRYNGNSQSEADTLVFPVLFSAWHAIELWLKSSIQAIYLITSNKVELKKNHHIYQYINILRDELNRCNMHQTIEIALPEVIALIEEFQRVGAWFDFSRYSFNSKGEYQFYNAPSGSNKQWQKNLPYIEKQIVPNTCVKLDALWEALVRISESFRDFVYYLTLVITVGGQLTDEAYINHLDICKKFENKLDDNVDDEIDPIKRIMNRIYLHIL